MARHPRVHLPGVPLHIVQRGHNRKRCFFYAVDYYAYLRRLRVALVSTRVALHAYCLMTNHVHLLITPSDVTAVPKLMMSLGRRYVQYVNRKYGRTGTLWDSRYKSCLIETESYLLACQRYIELNPVRAGIVGDPDRYRWSSYRFHAFGRFDPLLTPRIEYLALAEHEAERQDAYRRLFDGMLSDRVMGDIRRAINDGRPLGTDRYRTMVEQDLGRNQERPSRGRPRKSRSTLGAPDQETNRTMPGEPEALDFGIGVGNG